MEKNEEYLKQLESQKEISLNEFLKGFEQLTDYKDRETYLKNYFCKEIINILNDEEFIKLFYVDSQGKFLKDKLNSDLDLKFFSTLVYCYNTNSREFKKNKIENELKAKLESEGYTEQDILNEEELKKLNRLNVYCVLDVSKIGLLGSFDRKEEIKGKLIFNDYNNALYLMPIRHKKTGLLIRNTFYYKEIK